MRGDKGRVWLHGHLLGDESSAHVAQSVEHILGKDEVTGSNPVMGSARSVVKAERTRQGKNEFNNDGLTKHCASRVKIAEPRYELRSKEHG